MQIEMVTTCPYGHTCEKAEDGKIKRCAKYMRVAGTNPQTGEQVDGWRCSDAWQPIMLVELSRQMSSVGAAIESLRNELISSADGTRAMIIHAQQVARVKHQDTRNIN